MIAQKEATIDRFRERVMVLEQEVEKLQYQASNKDSIQILMDSLNQERQRSANLELKLSAYSEPTGEALVRVMQALTEGNNQLKAVNLEMSDRMLRLETWYQDQLRAYKEAKD